MAELTQPTAPAVDFTAEVNVHPVAELTLGRQVFNDSDKDNYFEG
ncbi:hypothetical protein ACQ86F_25500 [Streptomyces venezuelae ATCC 10712]